MGCGACSEHGKPCPQKDDAAEIIEKMIQSDVIVMATPVYFYAMDAQMKTLIDCTCSHYQEITGKEFFFIVTTADESRQAMGSVCGTGAWRMAHRRNPQQPGYATGIRTG